MPSSSTHIITHPTVPLSKHYDGISLNRPPPVHPHPHHLSLLLNNNTERSNTQLHHNGLYVSMSTPSTSVSCPTHLCPIITKAHYPPPQTDLPTFHGQTQSHTTPPASSSISNLFDYISDTINNCPISTQFVHDYSCRLSDPPPPPPTTTTNNNTSTNTISTTPTTTTTSTSRTSTLPHHHPPHLMGHSHAQSSYEKKDTI
eukprot:GHVQ01042273.1.p1 GENE.GHVQ01042273.1~~GHVQ01042273.1.p1  ORF type:complete len:226 (-),score=41.51 GHVQ01042273.1:18-620(-)